MAPTARDFQRSRREPGGRQHGGHRSTVHALCRPSRCASSVCLCLAQSVVGIYLTVDFCVLDLAHTFWQGGLLSGAKGLRASIISKRSGRGWLLSRQLSCLISRGVFRGVAGRTSHETKSQVVCHVTDWSVADSRRQRRKEPPHDGVLRKWRECQEGLSKQAV